MPVVHKSTIRRARQSEKRRRLNRGTMSAVKNLVKKVEVALDAKNADGAKASFRDAASALSKAVTKGVLKRNTASRRISRLALKVDALTASRS